MVRTKSPHSQRPFCPLAAFCDSSASYVRECECECECECRCECEYEYEREREREQIGSLHRELAAARG